MDNGYDKELLWSGAASSAFTASSPFSSYEKIQLNTNDGKCFEIHPYASTTAGQFSYYGTYSNQAYLVWNYRFTIGNNSTTFTNNRFQMLQQVGTARPSLAGFVNSASNLKRITACYGINALSSTGGYDGIGSPGQGWKEYNETVLYSGGLASPITLTEPATAFERLKFVVGSPSESINYYEYNAPLTSDTRLTTQSLWGTTTASYNYAFSWWNWYNDFKSLSSVKGKAYNFGTAAATPYTATGSTADQNYIRRPIRAIIGINHN